MPWASDFDPKDLTEDQIKEAVIYLANYFLTVCNRLKGINSMLSYAELPTISDMKHDYWYPKIDTSKILDGTIGGKMIGTYLRVYSKALSSIFIDRVMQEDSLQSFHPQRVSISKESCFPTEKRQPICGFMWCTHRNRQEREKYVFVADDKNNAFKKDPMFLDDKTYGRNNLVISGGNLNIKVINDPCEVLIEDTERIV